MNAFETQVLKVVPIVFPVKELVFNLQKPAKYCHGRTDGRRQHNVMIIKLKSDHFSLSTHYNRHIYSNIQNLYSIKSPRLSPTFFFLSSPLDKPLMLERGILDCFHHFIPSMDASIVG